MNVESIAEVKVLTSGYQAEYGRASGVQVTAVTKSGTNRFRGSVYDVERDSEWYANSKTNKLNGDPKTVLKEKDWGYSIGGPIGKPGGNNKLFFFYSQEFSPRTAGNNVVRYRMPTALERAGDFSQTTDNNGNPYPVHQGSAVAGACTARRRPTTAATACFQDGGVVGRIPADRLYQTGLNILKLYPLPNIPPHLGHEQLQLRAHQAVGERPLVAAGGPPRLSADAEAARDLQVPAWRQRDQTFLGSIPGFNDTRMQKAPVVSYTTSVNYTISPTMFLEATYGHSQNELAGCAQAQSSTGAIFCNNAAGSQGVPMTDVASLQGTGLGGLPVPVPQRHRARPGILRRQGARTSCSRRSGTGARMAKLPTFQWGGRIANAGGTCSSTCAPPTLGFPGWFNINSTNDFAISLTKVMGRHTIKTGFYNTHSYKAEQTSNNAFGTINFQQDTANPNDTSFGFSNAAIGTFSSFQQAKKYVETASIYNNAEAYIQDNWKVTSRLTLDYGVRFVHQGAQYDNAGAGVQLPAGQVVARGGADALRARLRQRRLPVHGQQPSGDESDHRPVPRAEHHERLRHARAEHRRTH